MNNSLEILAQKPKQKTLWKFTVKARNLDEALKIIQDTYPELKITKESVIHSFEEKPLRQGKLF